MAENPYSYHSLSGLERAKTERSLLCLLRACQGYRTMVELRNETTVLGKILNCDGFMNLTVEDVVVNKISGEQQEFTHMHILGSNIRYVHIPDEIDMQSAILGELTKLNRSRRTGSQFGRGRGNFRSRGRGR
ncbi:U7 snRNA-associated Sm-like protein LSm10 [Hydractinia symbiolongicarpus]|uniref:U7 snRNA-associated Sm-like protein LSm10 n=1 Tax=Hydractinia symbiolongicarpus TaxID=13093 RepID=UPI00254C6B27|nr:U7 snRNA-associated Sm-like protein LSm10 [Hydractinia symbiolongicarpus]